MIKITIDGKEYVALPVPVEETETKTPVEQKRTGLGKVDGIDGDYYTISNDCVGVNKIIDLTRSEDFDFIDFVKSCDPYTDRQLAIDTARANRIRNALRDYAAAHNKVVLDWEDEQQGKYYLKYMCNEDKIYIDCCCLIKQDDIYFDTRKTAEAAIEAVGRDDVTWLLRDFQPWIGAYKGDGK